MKAEPVTKVSIFYILVCVLLMFSNCIVATSVFNNEGGVRYQGEYFLHNGTSVLFYNCKVATSLFHHEGGVRYQGIFYILVYCCCFPIL